MRVLFIDVDPGDAILIGSADGFDTLMTDTITIRGREVDMNSLKTYGDPGKTNYGYPPYLSGVDFLKRVSEAERHRVR
jgi:hypothetical protein